MRLYRAATAQERLPEGLPNWFYDQDADGDGQVSMAEYLAASESAEAAAEEFMRYDTSSDGLVSPRECLDAADGATDKEESP